MTWAWAGSLLAWAPDGPRRARAATKTDVAVMITQWKLFLVWKTKHGEFRITTGLGNERRLLHTVFGGSGLTIADLPTFCESFLESISCSGLFLYL